jgi:L-asparaginase II
MMPLEFADNPILVRYWRGAHVESAHRGCWVLADGSGQIIESAGDPSFPIYARSSTKALQALPLIESGAADALDISAQELTMAVASHRGEPCHTEVVGAWLERLGFDPDDLHCGIHKPGDPITRQRLRDSGHGPSTLHNNCSGKHAGFLTLAKHLGENRANYLDLQSGSQQMVRQALLEMTKTDPERLGVVIDGCSAPTFRLPLTDLARGFARFANPAGLGTERRLACERLANAVQLYPDLLGGTRDQICSAISRATGGRLYPKIGAEAVYVIGERGGDRALAIKMDDGQWRALFVLTLHLLRRFGLAKEDELKQLDLWVGGPLQNWAGLEVGRVDVID